MCYLIDARSSMRQSCCMFCFIFFSIFFFFSIQPILNQFHFHCANAFVIRVSCVVICFFFPSLLFLTHTHLCIFAGINKRLVCDFIFDISIHVVRTGTSWHEYDIIVWNELHDTDIDCVPCNRTDNTHSPMADSIAIPHSAHTHTVCCFCISHLVEKPSRQFVNSLQCNFSCCAEKDGF